MATRNSIGSNKPIEVPFGGTGLALDTPYSVFCGGTTSINPFQNVSGLGTAGQVLTSNGAGALPTWQNAGGGVPFPYVGPTSFTPEFTYTYGASGVTYVDRWGYYVRLGDMLWFTLYIALSNKGTPSGGLPVEKYAHIRGIPNHITLSSTTTFRYGISGRIMNLASLPGPVVAPSINYRTPTIRSIAFEGINNTVGTPGDIYTFKDTNISNNTQFWMTGFYT